MCRCRAWASEQVMGFGGSRSAMIHHPSSSTSPAGRQLDRNTLLNVTTTQYQGQERLEVRKCEIEARDNRDGGSHLQMRGMGERAKVLRFGGSRRYLPLELIVHSTAQPLLGPQQRNAKRQACWLSEARDRARQKRDTASKERVAAIWSER